MKIQIYNNNNHEIYKCLHRTKNNKDNNIAFMSNIMIIEDSNITNK